MKPKQLRRYAELLATDSQGHWMDADGAWHLRPRCARAIYKRLKAGKGTQEEYERLCVMFVKRAQAHAKGTVQRWSFE